MPFIGWIIGDVDLTEMNIVLSPEVLNEAGEVATPAVVMAIGTFISTIIDFILVAFVVFLIVKSFNQIKAKAEEKKKAEEEAAAAAAAAAEEEKEPELSDEVKLLMEIRDLLKK
jgi:large conductance mechanosensitive channel